MKTALVIAAIVMVSAMPVAASAQLVSITSDGGVVIGGSAGAGTDDVNVGAETAATAEMNAEANAETGSGSSNDTEPNIVDTGGNAVSTLSAGASGGASASAFASTASGASGKNAGDMAAGSAEDDNSAGAGSAGITPDSPLWVIDVFVDKARLFLASTAEAKANVGLDIASERLAEMQETAETHKIEAFQKARLEHSNTILEIQKEVSVLDSQDTAVLISLQEKADAHAEAAADINDDLHSKMTGEGAEAVLEAFSESVSEAAADIKLNLNKIAEKRTNESVEQARNSLEEARTAASVCADASTITDAIANAEPPELPDPAVGIWSATHASACASIGENVGKAEEQMKDAESALDEKMFGEAFGQATAAIKTCNEIQAQAEAVATEKATEKMEAAKEAIKEARTVTQLCATADVWKNMHLNAEPPRLPDPSVDVEAMSWNGACVSADTNAKRAEVHMMAAQSAFLKGDMGEALGQASAALEAANDAKGAG